MKTLDEILSQKVNNVDVADIKEGHDGWFLKKYLSIEDLIVLNLISLENDYYDFNPKSEMARLSVGVRFNVVGDHMKNIKPNVTVTQKEGSFARDAKEGDFLEFVVKADGKEYCARVTLGAIKFIFSLNGEDVVVVQPENPFPRVNMVLHHLIDILPPRFFIV